jgi:hypothetical protein
VAVKVVQVQVLSPAMQARQGVTAEPDSLPCFFSGGLGKNLVRSEGSYCSRIGGFDGRPPRAKRQFSDPVQLPGQAARFHPRCGVAGGSEGESEPSRSPSHATQAGAARTSAWLRHRYLPRCGSRSSVREQADCFAGLTSSGSFRSTRRSGRACRSCRCKNGWTVRQLQRAIATRFGPRTHGGRRRAIPTTAEEFWLDVELMCESWRRWRQELERDPYEAGKGGLATYGSCQEPKANAG